MIDFAEIVGAELKRLRLREGMTQTEVATALHIARPIVARRERGKHLVSIENIDLHARACGGSLAHVLIRVDVATGAMRQGAGTMTERPRARATDSPRLPEVVGRAQGDAVLLIMQRTRARQLVKDSYDDSRKGSRLEFLVAARLLLIDLEAAEQELAAQTELAQRLARKLQEEREESDG